MTKRSRSIKALACLGALWTVFALGGGVAQAADGQRDTSGDLGAAILAGIRDLEAKSLMSKGRWAEAEAKYRSILSGLENMSSPDAKSILFIQQQISQAQIRQNNISGAKNTLNNAIDTAERIGGLPFDQLYALNIQLAEIYNYQGSFNEYEKVLNKLLSQSGSRSKLITQHKGRVFTQYANLLLRRGRVSEAEEFLKNRIDLLRVENDKGSKSSLTVCLLGLGELLGSELKFEEADKLFREALKLSEDSKDSISYRPVIAVAMSQNLIRLGRSREALDLMSAVGNDFIETKSVFTSEHLTYLSSLAFVMFHNRQYESGEKTLKEIILKSPEVGGSGGNLNLSAHALLADIYAEQRRWADAETEQKIVIEQTKELQGAQARQRFAAMSRLGLVMAKQGRVVQGEKLIMQARQSQIANLQRDDQTLLLSAADLAYVRLQPNGARDALTPAREALGRLRGQRNSSGGQRAVGTSFASEVPSVSSTSGLDVYESFAEAAWRAGKARPKDQSTLGNEVMVALQEASAGSISQAVVQATLRTIADDRASGLGALFRERQELAGVFAVNDSALSQARVTKSNQEKLVSKLEADQAKASARIDQIDAQIQQSFPDFEQFARPRQLDLKAVQGLLGEDEALLFVVPSEFGTHAMAVTRKGFSWNRSEWNGERVSAAVRRLLWDCGADVGVDAATAARWEAEAGGGYTYDRKTANLLYQQLVAPVAKTLTGKRKLYVVATGSLSSLPFGILLTQPPQGSDGDPQALRASSWLADAFAISAVPTIQTLQLLKSRAQRPAPGSASAALSFAGFGDPALGGRGISRGSRLTLRSAAAAQALPVKRGKIKNGVIAGQLKTLASLPGTAIELEGMRQALGAGLDALHVGPRDTEAAVKDSDLSHVQVLAFATHGLMAGELFSGAEAGLVFTPPKQASAKDDGYLTATEIMALRLNTDWVILSACNTAAGDGTSGAPGLSGLARSFFYAGARNLLVSHWPVRDDVAAKITVEAIRIRREKPGLSRGEAMQIAMRAVRGDASHDSPNDTWAHPNAWAPFSLVGEGN